MEQITIKEVAKLCGVGVSTVSRAINNHPDINEATKEATIAKDKILSDANDERRQLKEKTMNEISLEKEKAMKELKDQIVDVAFEASSKILEREVNSLDNKKIVDNFVEDLNKN